MKSLGLSFFTDIHWTLMGLLIFFSIFILMIVLHTRAYKVQEAKKMSNLPFEGDYNE